MFEITDRKDVYLQRNGRQHIELTRKRQGINTLPLSLRFNGRFAIGRDNVPLKHWMGLKRKERG